MKINLKDVEEAYKSAAKLALENGRPFNVHLDDLTQAILVVLQKRGSTKAENWFHARHRTLV